MAVRKRFRVVRQASDITATPTCRARVIAGVATVLAWVCLAWPDTGLRGGADLRVAEELVAYVDSTLAVLTPSSAGIVVSRGDQVLFETYLPGSSAGLPSVPVNETCLWPLSSGTKSYGAGLLLILVNDGILGLDDPVARFLPIFREPGSGPFPRTAVTLRHLASHTSGLGHADSEADSPPDSAVVLTEPGAVFRYSWLGVHFLELAMEAATGKDYEQLLNERLLGPLGLSHTRFVYERDPTQPIMPCMAGEFDDPARHYQLAHPGSRISHGLYATARELNRYCQLWAARGTFAGHTYFTPALAREAWRHHGTRAADDGAYGLLWWLFESEGGYVLSGSTHTVAAVVPDGQVVVTVTRNYRGHVPEQFSFYNDKVALVRFGKRLAAGAQVTPR